jgi:ABC-type uncharacterized transport system permease subunit
MLSNVTWFCFFASYLCAAALEAARIWNKSVILRWAALGFGGAGFLAHTAYLIERSRMADLPPLLSSTHDWLLVLAWLGVLMYLFVGLLDPEFSFGLFLLPVIVLVVGAARFVSDTTSATLNAQRSWGMLHAAMWVLGAAGVVIGLVLSVMYLIQHRRLRQKSDLHDGLELPSLERLGRLNWWAIVVSVPLLTIGMATGVGLALVNGGGTDAAAVPLTQPGILISALVWIAMMALFVWLLVARRTPGRLVAWRTLWAAGFLLVTLIVLQVFSRGGVHGVNDEMHTSEVGASAAGSKLPHRAVSRFTVSHPAGPNWAPA